MTAVIATSAVVNKTGQVGWVGLIVPHISRRLVGSDAQVLLIPNADHGSVLNAEVLDRINEQMRAQVARFLPEHAQPRTEPAREGRP